MSRNSTTLGSESTYQRNSTSTKLLGCDVQELLSLAHCSFAFFVVGGEQIQCPEAADS